MHDLTGSSPVIPAKVPALHSTKKRRRRSSSSSEIEVSSIRPQQKFKYEVIPDSPEPFRPPSSTLWPMAKKPQFIDLNSPTQPFRTRPRHSHYPAVKPSPTISSRAPPAPHTTSDSDVTSSHRASLTFVREVVVGTTFHSWEEGREAVYALENRLGYKWKMAQGKQVLGVRKKITLRCNHYYTHTPTHSPNLDPSDWRNGRSVRTNCTARCNLNRIQYTDMWMATKVERAHNHEREIPKGGFVPTEPSAAQRGLLTKFVGKGSFDRKQIAILLDDQFPDKPLEPRQISNMMNKARLEGRREIEALGGDIGTIIASLQQKNAEGGGWHFELRLDESQTVIGLFWQSPLQVALLRRFSDIVINDAAYNRNQYQYPLNIGIIIDNHGHSRNAWYAFQATEDLASHVWVLQCHLTSALNPPDAFVSDRHGSLIAGVEQTMPLTLHVFCLHHLEGNTTTQLRPILGPLWTPFLSHFWTAYRAVSSEEFDRLWQILTSKYPAAKKYLNEELYPCRKQWAWAWVSNIFTAGVRTNGRVESENRVNKTFGGAKKTLKQLFDSLNERTDGQTVKEMTEVRMVSLIMKSSDLRLVLTIINLNRLHVSTTLLILRVYSQSPYASFASMLAHMLCKYAGLR